MEITEDASTQDLLSIDFADAVFAPVPKKRGRPKGSQTTAIGLPKRKKLKMSGKPTPFHKKDSLTRQRHLLTFFVTDEDVNSAMKHSGMLLGEECVEMIPEHIPSACLDSHVDINIIRKYFDENGWAALVSVFGERKQMPWYCYTCQEVLEDTNSIGCDSCLNWQHWRCAAVKSKPKPKFWYCRHCKLE